MNVLVAGTGVTSRFGRWYYRPLTAATSGHLMVLPWYGLAPVEHAIQALRAELAGEKVNLLGHSQGGLVAAAYATRWPDEVATVITLAAPLSGTVLCHLPQPFPAGLDMRPGNTPEVGLHPGMVNVVARRDRLVLPYTSGLLPGAQHVRVDTGHLGLPAHPETLRIVHEALDRDGSAWAA